MSIFEQARALPGILSRGLGKNSDIDADLALVRRARKGDSEAFRCLMRRYQDRVYRTALSMTRDEGLAEDLTQDVFLRLHAKLAMFREESRFSTWFFRLAHNTMTDFVRRRRLTTVPLEEGLEVVDLSEEGRPLDQASRHQAEAAVAEALARLPCEYSEIVSAVYFQGLTYREAEGLLGVPEGALRTRMHRAKKILARELARLGVME